MSVTTNISTSHLNALIGGLDLNTLAGLSLQHAAALDGLNELLTPWTFTTVTASELVLQNGIYELSVSGSGIGPVSTIADFENALDTGIATGAFDTITISANSTDILDIDFDATGATFTSGTTELRLDGALPDSFGDLFDLAALAESLMNAGTLSAAQRTALVNDLSATSISSITLSDNGTDLLSIDLGDTQVTVSLGSADLTATGQLGDDLGDLAEIAFELIDNPGLSDPDLALYDASGNLVDYAFHPQMFISGLATGTYYLAVQAFNDAGTGQYNLTLSDFGITPPTNVTETTDAAGSVATSYTISNNATVNGAIDVLGDRDWYEFSYTAGTSLFATAETSMLPLSDLTSIDLTSLTLGQSGATTALAMTGDLLGLADGTASNTVTVDGEVFDTFFIGTIGASNPFAAVDSFFAAVGDRDFVMGLDGDDFLSGFDQNDKILGGSGNDYATGDSGNDTLMGESGLDTLLGGTGHDQLFGGADNDTLNGQQDNDLLGGGGGNDDLIGGVGLDTLNGAAGDDTLRGQHGNDSASGDGGSDLIFGGAGFDTLRGGAGDDTVNGGDGRDKVYMGGGDDLFVDNGQGGVNGQDTVFGNAGNDTFGGGGGNDVFHGQDGNDLLKGRLGDDRLFGGNQNDTLEGGAGDDTVAGGNGRDRAFMGDGNDRWFDNDQVQFGDDFVVGGRGDDTIEMNRGDDTATGGAGADQFEFTASDIGDDVITDFELGIDRIGIDGSLMPSLTQAALDAISDTSSGTLVLNFNADSSLTLQGLSSNAGLLADIFEL